MRFTSKVQIAAFIFFAINAPCFSQNVATGARAMGVANATAALHDRWAIINNPAGAADQKETVAAFSYQAVPYVKGFDRMAATILLPLSIGCVGFGVHRFGDDLYNEQFITLGYANTLGIASLGVKINYLEYHAETFGTGRAFGVTFGGIAKITPAFFIGAFAMNINQPRIGKSDQHVPARLATAIGLKLSENFFFTSEIEKDLEHDALLKAGAEYIAHKKFVARTGFNVNPQSFFAGAGFKLTKFNMDYAVQLQRQLGLSHQASVIWIMRKKA